MLVKVFRVAEFSGRKLNCFRRRPTAETTWRPTKLEVPAWGGIIDTLLRGHIAQMQKHFDRPRTAERAFEMKKVEYTEAQ